MGRVVHSCLLLDIIPTGTIVGSGKVGRVVPTWSRRPWSEGMLTVETRNVTGRVTAVGSAGPYTLVVDRPHGAGGGGLGFNGGQLLYLAIAGCVSNDLFREAQSRGIELTSVRVVVEGDFAGDPQVSTPVGYTVEIAGDASTDILRALVHDVDAIAEIPNSLRAGTPVRLGAVTVGGRPTA